MDILRCLLLSVHNKTLLLPYAAIAEVVSFEEVLPNKKGHKWILGEMEWRGLNIPLFSLESMIEGKKQDFIKGSDKRVAVLNRIGDYKFDFMGMMVQGIPRMTRVRKTDLKESKKADAPFLMELMVRDSKVFIPDLETIQKNVEKIYKSS